MIRVARIVCVLGKADNGKFDAHRVKLVFHDSKYEVSAYAKKLRNQEFLVEILSALIGREIGLPIPEPIIAISLDGNEVLFASVDVEFPDLTRRLNVDNNKLMDTPENSALLKKVSEWIHIYDAIGFDEWIANDDRNLGNILFDGKDKFFLIDHNQAMRLPFAPETPIDNKLLLIKLLFTQDEVGKQRIKNHISAMVDGIDPNLPESIVNRLLAQYPGLDRTILTSMVDFLHKRLGHIPEIANQKIITHQMSL
ncbi:hypothetical protein MGMO_8c01200 [Methyloglobulus morosus KoM1]|uniref:HipA-like kinase domain-containing protein n=1 Tax=Methyloglobulus morosus KoM1 TaxID=1116472 RepID=V5E342_9GAMM|nr:HipA family kinase [Methyloglobulus morosus]ESS73981.1 hypothetical protein MGMO_8c01200 [Methyloglobulus morosus KoM1]